MDWQCHFSNFLVITSLRPLKSFSPLLAGSVDVSERSRWPWPGGIWGYTPRKYCFPQRHTASSLPRGAYGGLQGAAETKTLWACCNSEPEPTGPARIEKAKKEKKRKDRARQDRTEQCRKVRRERLKRPDVARSDRTDQGQTEWYWTVTELIMLGWESQAYCKTHALIYID